MVKHQDLTGAKYWDLAGSANNYTKRYNIFVEEGRTEVRWIVLPDPLGNIVKVADDLKMAHTAPNDPLFAVLATELIEEDPILEAAIAIVTIEEEREENRYQQ
ncbi:hypothetical protein Pmani_024874 [Petrolisthes manimaculis]|uniref:Uncharacterized protein n=1 Tax=Petrolisthes manimaculis TaxID=1843537 RepID=A0AAE1P8C8_9EUCA|nr:hypothetical protein Pmani_024874 [Petrolisthes manimaculis]